MPAAGLGSPAGRDVTRVARSIRRNVAGLVESAHPRYALVYAIAHFVPRFSLGTVVARLYRLAGFRIGRGAAFMGPVAILGGPGIEDKLIVGDRVIVSTNVVINLDERVVIGDAASIGPFVRIYTGTHAIGPGSRRMLPQVVPKPVTIGRGAWIGVGAIVLPGVTIGDGSIVAAGSVVSTDLEPNVYADGNPAQVRRELPWGDR